MTLSPQWLDELRSRTTLSTLIGRHVKIQRAGREYKACCPFHNEKTPSFTINDSKGFYHCFGCSAHGDAIGFLIDYRGLSFMDAVKELADEAGMQVPAPDPKAAQQARERATLHEVMQGAQNWFTGQLNSIAGAEARAYLERRGLSDATIASFGFGYAPDRRDGIATALPDAETGQLVEIGMLIQVEDKAPYDRFRGRVMIPIRDARGRVIAFGGRILGDGEPKYLNSPDTPLFDKGRTLYNLDRASQAARQTGRVIVVEGYMDVIALAQAGFEDAVAPLGTALTETQLAMLWKMVETPILCFDGDAAGQRAAMRAAERALPLLEPGKSLDFVLLPAGLDPDDLIRESGPEAFGALVASPRPLLDFLWERELAARPLETPEQRAGLKERLEAHAAAIQHGDVRALYAKALRERFSDTFFRRQASATPRRDGPRSSVPRGVASETKQMLAGSGDAVLETAVIAGILRYPELIGHHFEELSELDPNSADQRRILEIALRAAHTVPQSSESLDSKGLITILADQGMNDMAKNLLRADSFRYSFTQPHPDPMASGPSPAAVRDFSDALGELRHGAVIRTALEEAKQRFRADLSEEAREEQVRLQAWLTRHRQSLYELHERAATGTAA